jgi:methionyl-tRNA formyltransferase
MPRWRTVLVSTVPEAIGPIVGMLEDHGHEAVAVITRPRVGFPGVDEMVAAAQPALDVLVPRAKERLAPLVRATDPDLLLCLGFPWLIPDDALEIPRVGAVNMHPSLLPRYRGPNPIGWTYRNDDSEMGLTFHRMVAHFDTGTILAQGSVPVHDDDHLETIGRRLEPLAASLFPRVLERLAAGDPGDPQRDEDAVYAGLMEDEWAEIDWTRPARDVHNQVRSWTLPSKNGIKGALTTLDGDRVRVIRTSLHPPREGNGPPGQVVGREHGRPLVQCGDGRAIWVLQMEPV